MGNNIPSWDDRYHMEAQKGSHTDTHIYAYERARIHICTYDLCAFGE